MKKKESCPTAKHVFEALNDYIPHCAVQFCLKTEKLMTVQWF